MSGLQWLIVVTAVIGSLSTVFMIGREREPITPGQACISILANVAVVVLALTVLAP